MDLPRSGRYVVKWEIKNFDPNVLDNGQYHILTSEIFDLAIKEPLRHCRSAITKW